MVINYDEDAPENHDPFAVILPAIDIPGIDGKTFYHGFILWYEYDIRALFSSEEDVVKARIWTKNSVLVTVYAVNKKLEDDRDNMQLRTHERNALDNFHFSYNSRNPPTPKKHFLIKFPNEVVLDAKKIFNHNDNEDDVVIQPRSIMDEYNVGSRVNFSHFAVLTIARTDKGAYKKAKYQKPAGGHMHHQTGIAPPSAFSPNRTPTPGGAAPPGGPPPGSMPPPGPMPYGFPGTSSMPAPFGPNSMPYASPGAPSASTQFGSPYGSMPAYSGSGIPMPSQAPSYGLGTAQAQANVSILAIPTFSSARTHGFFAQPSGKQLKEVVQTNPLFLQDSTLNSLSPPHLVQCRNLHHKGCLNQMERHKMVPLPMVHRSMATTPTRFLMTVPMLP